MPSLTSPTPIGRQSFNSSAPNASDSTASVEIPQATAVPFASPVTGSDITGSIPAMLAGPTGRKLTTIQVPPTETLPDAIGGPVLRSASLNGHPSAAH